MVNTWQNEKQAIEKKYGKWFSYDLIRQRRKTTLANFAKNSDQPTIYFFRKIVTCAQDMLKKPLASASVLDLACGEGIATLAFADYGVKSILGIDGREANVVKAKFAAHSLAFKHAQFKTVDVRNITIRKKFDVVLALGIAYHLDVPDLFHFVEKLYQLSSGIVIIDTHIALVAKIKQQFRHHDYYGLYYQELTNNISNESSIGNTQSFWLTQASLRNLVTRIGFSGIYEFKPLPDRKWRGTHDRLIIIATKEPRREFKYFSTPPSSQTNFFSESDPRVVTANNVNIVALQEFRPATSK